MSKLPTDVHIVYPTRTDLQIPTNFWQPGELDGVPRQLWESLRNFLQYQDHNLPDVYVDSLYEVIDGVDAAEPPNPTGEKQYKFGRRAFTFTDFDPSFIIPALGRPKLKFTQTRNGRNCVYHCILLTELTVENYYGSMDELLAQLKQEQGYGATFWLDEEYNLIE